MSAEPTSSSSDLRGRSSSCRHSRPLSSGRSSDRSPSSSPHLHRSKRRSRYHSTSRQRSKRQKRSKGSSESEEKKARPSLGRIEDDDIRILTTVSIPFFSVLVATSTPYPSIEELDQAVVDAWEYAQNKKDVRARITDDSRAVASYFDPA